MDRFTFFRAMFPALSEASKSKERVLFEGRCCFLDAENRGMLFFSPSDQNEDCTEFSAVLSVCCGISESFRIYLSSL